MLTSHGEKFQNLSSVGPPKFGQQYHFIAPILGQIRHKKEIYVKYNRTKIFPLINTTHSPKHTHTNNEV